MSQAATLFTPWESFYVIVGSSGAALTGLQFVVMALVADARRKGNAETVNAFGTPTVVHFCMALAVAAILSAPWERALAPAIILALCGLGGIVYATVVTGRAQRQSQYKLVGEDWVWHIMLPLIAYVVLLGGAIGVALDVEAGLFAIGATTLLLLFIGIHNAWDSIAYVATQQFGNAPPTL